MNRLNQILLTATLTLIGAATLQSLVSTPTAVAAQQVARSIPFEAHPRDYEYVDIDPVDQLPPGGSVIIAETGPNEWLRIETSWTGNNPDSIQIFVFNGVGEVSIDQFFNGFGAPGTNRPLFLPPDHSMYFKNQGTQPHQSPPHLYFGRRIAD